MHYFIYNERKKHGTTEFPVAYYKVNCEQSGYNVPFHWHQEWELIRVLKGDFPMYIDGQEYQVRAGDVLLLREGMLHGGNHQKCVYQCFDFDLHGLFLNVLSVKEYLRPFYRNRLHPIVHFKEYQKDIYPIVDELLGAFEKDSAEGVRALTTLACIARLFAVILEKGYYTVNQEQQEETVQKTDRLKPVLEYIDNHFDAPLTLDELAGVAGMNPRYFCRFFSSVIQQTPMNYVAYYRIEQAATMLCNPQLSVTEVGLECGFCDTSHFVKIFKKFKGVTPKQFQLRNA